MRQILIIFIFGVLSCGQSTSQVINNKLGGYSLKVLSGWTHKLEGEDLLISKTITDSKSVISISSLKSDFETLEESVSHYTNNLVSYFDNARKVSQGESYINGLKTFWYRMKANQGSIRQEVLIYMLQFDNRKFIYLICVAREDRFVHFEEDITKMVYSLKRLR